MCPFVEKKEKIVVFSLTYKVLRNRLHYFFNPVQPPSIINNYYNVQPPLLFQPLLLFGTRE